jgi:hypothetical protein
VTFKIGRRQTWDEELADRGMECVEAQNLGRSRGERNVTLEIIFCVLLTPSRSQKSKLETPKGAIDRSCGDPKRAFIPQ